MRRKVNYSSAYSRKLDSLLKELNELDIELESEILESQDIKSMLKRKANLEAEVTKLRKTQNERSSRMV